MPILLPLASGKGGVGKSVFAANLAYQLASRKKKVILVDLDWGGSNAHTILGVLNTNAGVGDFMLDKERRLADLVVPLDVPGLFFIPGDGSTSGAANLPLVRKQKMLKELPTLDADYVILDLGAGSHFNTVDVFLSSALSFIVTTPEPTAVLNAYGFLKTALFRLLVQAVPAKSLARTAIQSYFAGKGTSGKKGLDELFEGIGATEPQFRDRLEAAKARLKPRVILNQGVDSSELSLGAKLRQVCEKQLGMGIEYVALVPWDPAVRTSVIERKLLSRYHPESPFARAVGVLAQRIIETGFPSDPPLGTFYDLEGLATDFPQG